MTLFGNYKPEINIFSTRYKQRYRKMFIVLILYLSIYSSVNSIGSLASFDKYISSYISFFLQSLIIIFTIRIIATINNKIFLTSIIFKICSREYKIANYRKLQCR